MCQFRRLEVNKHNCASTEETHLAKENHQETQLSYEMCEEEYIDCIPMLFMAN